MSASKSSYLIFEEIGEEILFIVWSAWQYLRIIMLIKNQKRAKEEAVDIIDFTQEVDLENTTGFDGHNKFELHLEDKPRK